MIVPVKLVPSPTLSDRPRLTQGQQKTAKMLTDLIGRIERREGVYGRKDVVLNW